MRCMFSILMLVVCSLSCRPVDSYRLGSDDNDPYAKTIRDRIEIYEIDIDTPIDVGVYRYNDNRYDGAILKNVVLSTMENGQSKIAWTDKSGNIHITPLDASNKRMGSDFIIQKAHLFDMYAHDDGSVAVLATHSDRARLTLLDQNGVQIFSNSLYDQRSPPSRHSGRLAWNGQSYAAYYGITGSKGYTSGHNGDTLRYVSKEGKVTGKAWDWGCSHMMDNRILYSADVNDFISICLSDAYPSHGIHFNHRTKLLSKESSADQRGSTNAKVGGMVDLNNNFVVAFASKQGRRSWDSAMLSFQVEKTDNKYSVTLKPKTWLSDTQSINEVNMKIGRCGDNLLISWMDKAKGNYTFSFRDLDGNLIGEAEDINTVKTGPTDDFKNFSNGDVAWAYAWDDMSKLKLVRVSGCN